MENSRLTGVLTPTEAAWFADRPKFIREWFLHSATYWTWSCLERLIAAEPAVGWSAILDLVRNAPNDGDLIVIAINPLTQLLQQHGDRFAPEVLKAASMDERFRLCLSYVEQYDFDTQNIPPVVLSQIRQLRDLRSKRRRDVEQREDGGSNREVWCRRD